MRQYAGKLAAAFFANIREPNGLLRPRALRLTRGHRNPTNGAEDHFWGLIGHIRIWPPKIQLGTPQRWLRQGSKFLQRVRHLSGEHAAAFGAKIGDARHAVMQRAWLYLQRLHRSLTGWARDRFWGGVEHCAPDRSDTARNRIESQLRLPCVGPSYRSARPSAHEKETAAQKAQPLQAAHLWRFIGTCGFGGIKSSSKTIGLIEAPIPVVRVAAPQI